MKWTILEKRHYYGGCHEVWRVALDPHADPLTYHSEEEAHAVIIRWNESLYIVNHNESCRPSYCVVPIGSRQYRQAYNNTWTGPVDDDRR